MKVSEIIILVSNLLKTLHKSGVKMSDCEYIGMYQEYQRRRMSGEKITAIVMSLAEEYGCSERFVYKVVKKFEQDCTDGAV